MQGVSGLRKPRLLPEALPYSVVYVHVEAPHRYTVWKAAVDVLHICRFKCVYPDGHTSLSMSPCWDPSNPPIVFHTELFNPPQHYHHLFRGSLLLEPSYFFPRRTLQLAPNHCHLFRSSLLLTYLTPNLLPPHLPQATTSTPCSQTSVPLNEINWSGVYARRLVERAYVETRIRQHHRWFRAELGGTDRAVLRYVFPPFFCSRQITFADPPAGMETAGGLVRMRISFRCFTADVTKNGRVHTFYVLFFS